MRHAAPFRREVPAPTAPPAYARLVLHIVDARTGESVPAVPARRGPTRVQAHAPGPEASALRVLLVADLLFRTLELDGTPVWALLSGGPRTAELREAAAALGAGPFEEGPDPVAGLSGTRTVHVVEKGAPVPESGAVVEVGPVVEPPDLPLAGLLDPAADPAVLRLALLSVPHATPARLDGDSLAAARETLARWRRAVADWARRPSRPVPDEVRTRLRAAREDNLDMAGVLDVLRSVESGTDLPEGARFETYAHADRLLGLDLVRDIGRTG